MQKNRKKIIELALQFTDGSYISPKMEGSFTDFLEQHKSPLLNHLLSNMMNSEVFEEAYYEIALSPYTNVSTLVDLYWTSTPHQAYADYMPELFKKMNPIIVDRLKTAKASDALFEFQPEAKTIAKLSEAEKAALPAVLFEHLKGEKFDFHQLESEALSIQRSELYHNFDFDGTELFKASTVIRQQIQNKEMGFVLKYEPINISIHFPKDWELTGYTSDDNFDESTPISTIVDDKTTIYLSKYTTTTKQPYDCFFAKPEMGDVSKLSLKEMMAKALLNYIKIQIRQLTQPKDIKDFAFARRTNNHQEWGILKIDKHDFYITHHISSQTNIYKIQKIFDNLLFDIECGNVSDFPAIGLIDFILFY